MPFNADRLWVFEVRACRVGSRVGGGWRCRAILPTTCTPLIGLSPTTASSHAFLQNFSRYGAVAGLRILIDEATGLCNGTG